MILHDKKEGGLVRGQIVLHDTWTAYKLKFDGSKVFVLELKYVSSMPIETNGNIKKYFEWSVLVILNRYEEKL